MARTNAWGFARMFRLIGALHAAGDAGMVTAEVATAIGSHITVTTSMLCRLRTLGLLRREKTRVGPHHNTYRWLLGEDADRTNQRGRLSAPKSDTITFAVLVKTLRVPRTAEDVAREVGIHEDTARRHIQMGRKVAGAFPVVAWAQRRNVRAAVYQFAPGQEDAPRPPRKPRSQTVADRVAREKAERRRIASLRERSAHASIFNLAQAVGRAA